MTLTNEPRPKAEGNAGGRRELEWPTVVTWDDFIPASPVDFHEVLASRRSSTGGRTTEADLAAILKRSTELRHRGADGRFGEWESRSSPASGGLHALSLLCLSVDQDGVSGFYDVDRHSLLAADDLAVARKLNFRSVSEIAGTSSGTTVQLVADVARYQACYDGWQSLALRDAGALAMTICLSATVLRVRSVVLGRLGHEIVAAAGLDNSYVGVGAVHLGGRQ